MDEWGIDKVKKARKILKNHTVKKLKSIIREHNLHNVIRMSVKGRQLRKHELIESMLKHKKLVDRTTKTRPKFLDEIEPAKKAPTKKLKKTGIDLVVMKLKFLIVKWKKEKKSEKKLSLSEKILKLSKKISKKDKNIIKSKHPKLDKIIKKMEKKPKKLEKSEKNREQYDTIVVKIEPLIKEFNSENTKLLKKFTLAKTIFKLHKKVIDTGYKLIKPITKDIIKIKNWYDKNEKPRKKKTQKKSKEY